jgi:hypothetical protein
VPPFCKARQPPLCESRTRSRDTHRLLATRPLVCVSYPLMLSVFLPRRPAARDASWDFGSLVTPPPRAALPSTPSLPSGTGTVRAKQPPSAAGGLGEERGPPRPASVRGLFGEAGRREERDLERDPSFKDALGPDDSDAGQAAGEPLWDLLDGMCGQLIG